MKKLLMTAALLVVGATAFGAASAPVSVSLNVVETSQLVLMDEGQPLTQIDLQHKQILLSSAKITNKPSIVTQNFKVQTGDGKVIKVSNADATTLAYTLEGVAAGTGALPLVGVNGATLPSTLKLTVTNENITSSSEGAQNAIVSTIAPNDLNALTGAGTFTASATLKVTAS